MVSLKALRELVQSTISSEDPEGFLREKGYANPKIILNSRAFRLARRGPEMGPPPADDNATD
jgi:hypothetical protein